MKSLLSTSLTVILLILSLQSCTIGNDTTYPPVSDNISQAFSLEFPDVNPGDVSWKQIGFYHVASFAHNGTDKTAWFGLDAMLRMTEHRLDPGNFRGRLTSLYGADDYLSGWQNERAWLIERPGLDTEYILEMKRSPGEVHELYMTEDNIVFKTADIYGTRDYSHIGEISNRIPPEGLAYISAAYPGARLVYMNLFFPMIPKAVIVDGYHAKTLTFDIMGNFQLIQWNVTRDYVIEHDPAVDRAFRESGYLDNYTLVNMEYLDPAAGTVPYYYTFTLSDEGGSYCIDIAPDGTMSEPETRI